MFQVDRRPFPNLGLPVFIYIIFVFENQSNELKFNEPHKILAGGLKICFSWRCLYFNSYRQPIWIMFNYKP